MYKNSTQNEEYCPYHIIMPADPYQNTGALLLGDLHAATDVQLMKSHNVKTIITAASGLEHLQIPSEQTHVIFPLLDLKDQKIQPYFELSYQTIEHNLKKGAVLVHCGAGISRSATLVIAYYMKKHELLYNQALNHVKRIRPNVNPGAGYQNQLKQYEAKLGLDKQQQKIKIRSQIEDLKHQLFATKQITLNFYGSPNSTVKTQRSKTPSLTNRTQKTKTNISNVYNNTGLSNSRGQNLNPYTGIFSKNYK